MRLPSIYLRSETELPDNDQLQFQHTTEIESADRRNYKKKMRWKNIVTSISGSRKLILCRGGNCRNNKPYPYVILKGIWLRRFGFCPGDQVTITSPEERTLIIQMTKSAEEVNKERMLK